MFNDLLKEHHVSGLWNRVARKKYILSEVAYQQRHGRGQALKCPDASLKPARWKFHYWTYGPWNVLYNSKIPQVVKYNNTNACAFILNVTSPQVAKALSQIDRGLKLQAPIQQNFSCRPKMHTAIGSLNPYYGHVKAYGQEFKPLA